MDMCRGWTLFIAVLWLGGCGDDTTGSPVDSEPGSAPRFSGTYQVEQRCNGLGPARVDLTARGRGGNYFLLVRGGDASPVYAAVDRLELDLAWNNDSEAFEEAADGLPIYNWQARPTKDAGWLEGPQGTEQMPEAGRVAFDRENNRFFFETACAEAPRAPAHAFQHQDTRLVLHDLNVAMAKARADLHQQAGLRYMEQRRDYQGGSGREGVSAGHEDRNRHLLNVAELMQADAKQNVPGLARLVAENRPSDEAAAQRYQQELPAYLRAAARAHARWYIDAADIRLDWFNGNYPEGEAAIREGMAALQDAYLGMAGQ
ncbi:MAG: hypothetical protein RH947_02140 [Alcanivorax sp.]|jgi:hypothetical protein